MTGKQTVQQLVSHPGQDAEPSAKFENADLNQLSKMGFLDELISGIKTGKEASVYLGKNSDGFVAVKVYTDLRVRSFKRDGSYREGRFIGDSRIEKAIEQGSQKGLDAHQILWVQEEFRQMNRIATKVNAVLRGLCDRRSLSLSELNLTFGRLKGQPILCGELSPVTCHFLDASSEQKNKRDRFTFGHDNTLETLMELADRLMVKA